MVMVLSHTNAGRDCVWISFSITLSELVKVQSKSWEWAVTIAAEINEEALGVGQHKH